MKKTKLFMLTLLTLTVGAVACGDKSDTEKAGSKTEEKVIDGTTDDSITDDGTTDDGICDDNERAVSRVCGVGYDSNKIKITHLDRACSASKTYPTYVDEESCLKYAVEIKEIPGFSINQKGICGMVNGEAACILDTEYACPEVATHFAKCVDGKYLLKYWSWASCGEITVEEVSECPADAEEVSSK